MKKSERAVWDRWWQKLQGETHDRQDHLALSQ